MQVTLETIKKHWKPLRLRALRLAKGLSLADVAGRLGLKKTQINGWELGTRFESYKNKKLIYQAYGIGEEEIEPTHEQLERLQSLLNNFSREEIQMAYDIQTAEARCARYDDTRRRAIKKSQEGVKTSTHHQHVVRG